MQTCYVYVIEEKNTLVMRNVTTNFSVMISLLFI